MTTRQDHNVEHDTEIIERPVTDRMDRVDRVERIERVERPADVAPAGQVNVRTSAASPVWTATRVVTLLFTVLEVLLLVRFAMKLLGANATQPLVSALYGITEPLVRPFQGIFSQTNQPVVFDLPALLAILFLFLVAALVVALVRAVAGRNATA